MCRVAVYYYRFVWEGGADHPFKTAFRFPENCDTLAEQSLKLLSASWKCLLLVSNAKTEVVEMSSNLSSNYLQFNFGMENGSKHSIYGFDKFRLDCGKLMLYSDGEPVTLAPKVVKTLVVLVESRGSILSKDELMERVWEDSIVEEANLSQNLYLLRKTLGSKPDGAPYIETLRRRGYRFNGEVDRLFEETSKTTPPPQPHPETASAFVGVERRGNVLRVVDWQTPQIPGHRPEPVPHLELVTGPRPPAHRSWILRLAFAAVGLLLVGVVTSMLLWPNLMPAATTAESQAELSILRLTNGFVPYGATISPDGNLFVYHEVDGDNTRMFVQQTGQSSRIEIGAGGNQLYGAKTFFPDGQSIFYAASDRKTHQRSLYRIPTIGGSAVKVLDDISGAVSFSPDGKEMVFCRRNAATGDTAMIIAGSDGRAERVITQRKGANSLQLSPAWSPDGKSIAYGEKDLYNRAPSGTHRVNILNVATGKSTHLSEENWQNILRIVWSPDGKGIFTLGTRDGDGYTTRRDQVYFISYPEGVSRRLTSDGNRHEPESLGVSKKGGVLSVSASRSCQMWMMNSDGDANSAVQLTKGSADGRAGIGLLPDGRFAFLTRNADEIPIMIANSDASNVKQIATGFPILEELRADPLGRFFVFSTLKDSNHRIFRIDVDGSNLKQLTFGEGGSIDSSLSPDGKYLVFDRAVEGNDVTNHTIMRMPTDGGEPVALVKNCYIPTYSPDGSMISCVSSLKPEIVIVSATDGAELERHPLPLSATWNFGVGWTADGSGLVYINNEKGVFNLWILPRDGSKPRALTNFTSGVIYRYAFANDGSKIYLARGYPTQDAVLIRNFR